MPLFFQLFLLGVGLAAAASLPSSKSAKGPGYVHVPLTAVNRTAVVTSRKRQDNTPLYNPEYGIVYLADVFVGTPPQEVYLLLDTGSSETWVDPACSTASNTNQVNICNSFPRYDPHSSSTAGDLGYPFSLGYGKGTVDSEYLIDTFIVGNANIPNVQFGWAAESVAISTGILAVGYGYEITGYYCLVDMMATEEIINSRAFSVALGSVDSFTGSILFGGIDTKKYTGPLEKRPILPDTLWLDGMLRYWINMTSVGITKPGSTTSKLYTVPTYQQPLFLDSGSTLSTLPSNLVQAILADFTGVVANGNGIYTVDCNQTALPGTLDFGFGNTIIHVPFHEFIWTAGPSICFFGVIAQDPSYYYSWILGDTFLRSAYVVYDQDNANLWLANYVDCGSNIVPIGSGANAVPSIAGACSPTITPGGKVISTTSTSPSKSLTTSVALSTSTKPASSTTTTSITAVTSSTSSRITTTSSLKSTSSTTSSLKSTSTSIKATTTSTAAQISSSSIKTTSTSTSTSTPHTTTLKTSTSSTKTSSSSTSAKTSTSTK